MHLSYLESILFPVTLSGGRHGRWQLLASPRLSSSAIWRGGVICWITGIVFSFGNPHSHCVCCVFSRSVVSWLFVTPWTVACQAPLSMGIPQARIMEWIAMPSSRGSSQPKRWNAGLPHSHSVQFSCQSCPTLCDPMNLSTPGLPVHHQLPEFTQTHVHQVSDAIQPSHLLSSPSPPAPNPSQHQSLFQWVNSSHEVAKVLEFQL